MSRHLLTLRCLLELVQNILYGFLRGVASRLSVLRILRIIVSLLILLLRVLLLFLIFQLSLDIRPELQHNLIDLRESHLHVIRPTGGGNRLGQGDNTLNQRLSFQTGFLVPHHNGLKPGVFQHKAIYFFQVCPVICNDILCIIKGTQQGLAGQDNALFHDAAKPANDFPLVMGVIYRIGDIRKDLPEDRTIERVSQGILHLVHHQILFRRLWDRKFAIQLAIVNRFQRLFLLVEVQVEHMTALVEADAPKRDELFQWQGVVTGYGIDGIDIDVVAVRPTRWGAWRRNHIDGDFAGCLAANLHGLIHQALQVLRKLGRGKNLLRVQCGTLLCRQLTQP